VEKQYNIEAEVTGPIKDGFRLKISELNIGMYISGFTARKSPRNASERWIQPPATYQKKTGSYVRCPEFDTHTTFWEELVEEVDRAIKIYTTKDNITATSTSADDATDFTELDSVLDALDKKQSEGTELKAIPWMDDDDQ
jgi:hypothetical protein